ncbi:GNAT family N-acetyltransferase [Rathayibacter toxicus]|uniref:GNAT family N-acetyltransferase n=1 Tax=Rathayibacter toxicus TaxID=145458 RepID=A0A2S5Y6V2_9MICO|nr:GNAT family N-acetyltransferase [Rathayibacter toxicus]PPH23674.1 GNAT family N-acetyltransferase [Rathayibacter toxicus]PPH57480.1 GNAT family N-acetyltransferase [Rathayibacter toxicus]PPH59979.1 GNAT family N-acetyltransferase [Rathayibacter toxicus]PPH87435.1 GNAT family N-acetyltransferase [Rathayibacter toxicus]PPI15203.1 GNAT family N-acetyltransferase [Rathayibacter toxicus]
MATEITLTSAVPSEIWERIAHKYSFYSSPSWLHFSDSDCIATAAYIVASVDHEVRALLPAYWSPHENNVLYQPPAPDLLILGGRRGYLSAPLLATPADALLLRDVVAAAIERFPEAQGRWWWPYVLDDGARLIAEVFSFDEDHIALAGADAVIDVPNGGVAEHIDRLTSQQRRTNARRELRRFQESGFYIDEAPLGDQAKVLGPLLSQVQQRYGHDHGPFQMTALLERQSAYLQESSVVFRCRRQSDDTIVGFSLGYRRGHELAIRVVGFDYAAVENIGAYASLSIYAPIDYCARSGLSILHLGMESLDAKSRRGARVRPLWELSTQCFSESQRNSRTAVIDQLPAREAEDFVHATSSLRAQIAKSAAR